MSWFSSLFSRSPSASKGAPRIFFHNTLGNSKELFVPLKPHQVTLYSCGPTVYGQQHVGNLRPAVCSDTIARVLMHAGYHVRRVINITDVGHLVGDTDEGEDKMAVGANRENVSPQEIAARYTKQYLEDLGELNIDTGHILFPRATEYIREQIALARTLEEKGFAYRIYEGLYFDTSKFPRYGELGNRMGVALKEGARVAAVKDKRNPNDFVLWRTAKPHDLQQWDSPWGRGNPGWHIECSAMSRALLGITLDIHTGGEDLVSVHHNDEIAQSEAANGRQFVRYWLHNAFLTIEGEKVSKSLHNEIYLSQVEAKGIHPLALRYFFLQAHYRTPVSFSWDALMSAQEALIRLWRAARELKHETSGKGENSIVRDQFIISMRDDLATPQAIGLMWEGLKSDEYTEAQKWGLLIAADALLGLRLVDPPDIGRPLHGEEIPPEVKKLLEEREEARQNKKFEEADRLRAEIESRGYRVDDSPSGAILTRTTL